MFSEFIKWTAALICSEQHGSLLSTKTWVDKSKRTNKKDNICTACPCSCVFLTPTYVAIQISSIYSVIKGGAMAQRVQRWTCDQQVVGSNPTRGKSCVTTLDKLFTPVCLCHKAVYITWYTYIWNYVHTAKWQWCSAIGKVTAGLTESDGSLPPGGWLIVTCGLTACTPGSALGPTLSHTIHSVRLRFGDVAWV